MENLARYEMNCNLTFVFPPQDLFPLDTVDTRNSGPRYSGFTCFSEQNCADQLRTYEVNSHLKQWNT